MLGIVVLQSFLLILLGTKVSEAHLKLFYLPWQMPIRNAPSAISDGIFSAAANQPCGGPTDWGRNQQQRYARVVDGQKVCARVNWNGGHQNTPGQNFLQANFRCNRPGQPQDLLQVSPLPLAPGTNPPPEPNGYLVDATPTNLNYDGYMVCVYLPVQGITAAMDIWDSRRQCTLAIMEGNGWGGCMDMLLYVNGTIPELTPAPLPSPSLYWSQIGKPLNLTSSEGTYRINNCFTDAGGKCCLIGFFGVRNNGAVSARIYGTDPTACLELNGGYQDKQMILQPSKYSENLYETNFYLYMGYDQFGRYVSVQNMSISLRDGGSMYISNVGLDIPYVADHDVTYYSTLENGLANNVIPWPNYSTSVDSTPWGLIFLGIIGSALLIYLVGGAVYGYMHEGRFEHPHVHALLVQLGCVRKRRKKVVVADDPDVEKPVLKSAAQITPKPKSGYSLALPPKWNSAIDPMSAEVYYFNTETKEVRWDRPTF